MPVLDTMETIIRQGCPACGGRRFTLRAARWETYDVVYGERDSVDYEPHDIAGAPIAQGQLACAGCGWSQAWPAQGSQEPQEACGVEPGRRHRPHPEEQFWVFVLRDGESWQTYGTLTEVFREACEKLPLADVIAIIAHRKGVR